MIEIPKAKRGRPREQFQDALPVQQYGGDYEAAARRAKLIARITATEVEIRREDDTDD